MTWSKQGSFWAIWNSLMTTGRSIDSIHSFSVRSQSKPLRTYLADGTCTRKGSVTVLTLIWGGWQDNLERKTHDLSWQISCSTIPVDWSTISAVFVFESSCLPWKTTIALSIHHVHHTRPQDHWPLEREEGRWRQDLRFLGIFPTPKWDWCEGRMSLLCRNHW